ncbi:hypothetical protein D3C77_514140 [compost metagenome]
MGIPPGLGLAKLVFQVADELLLPLGLGLLTFRADMPVGAESGQDLRRQRIGWNGVGEGEGLEGFWLWLPVGQRHGESPARVTSTSAFTGYRR